MLDNEQLDLLLVYLPHLDYDHQRFGPGGEEALRAARELDEVAGSLVEHARARGDQVVVLSEYGITEARRPVEINRALRRAGLLNVYTQAGMEYLDPWTSKAFAVADHQIAHIYTSDVAATRSALEGLDGLAELLSGDDLAGAGLAHERSGELVALAERDAWFTYHYWLDNEHAPDFGRQVEIHRKPGYDPAELFFDPDDERGAKLRGGLALARKTVGDAVRAVGGGPRRVQARPRHARAAARRRRGRAGVPVLGGVGGAVAHCRDGGSRRVARLGWGDLGRPGGIGERQH